MLPLYHYITDSATSKSNKHSWSEPTKNDYSKGSVKEQGIKARYLIPKKTQICSIEIDVMIADKLIPLFLEGRISKKILCLHDDWGWNLGTGDDWDKAIQNILRKPHPINPEHIIYIELKRLGGAK